MSDDKGVRPKGMFLGDKRVTGTEQIFKNEARLPIPAPTKYGDHEAWKKTLKKIPGNYK